MPFQAFPRISILGASVDTDHVMAWYAISQYNLGLDEDSWASILQIKLIFINFIRFFILTRE